MCSARVADGMDAGASVADTLSCPVPADLEPGLWYVGALIDSRGEVIEGDEENNAAVVPDPIEVR